MDYIYPRAKPVITEDTIDEASVASDIIALVEAGEGSKIVVVSKALKGSNAVRKVSAVYDEIKAEKQAMANVSISDCKTEKEYTGKLAAREKHLDPAKYFAGVKAEAVVTTWTALKTKLSPVEIKVV